MTPRSRTRNTPFVTAALTLTAIAWTSAPLAAAAGWHGETLPAGSAIPNGRAKARTTSASAPWFRRRIPTDRSADDSPDRGP